MNQVLLQPDGCLCTTRGPAMHDVLSCLGHQVLLADGCRLRTFFRLLEKYPDLRRLSEFLPLAIAQYQACPADECRWASLARLELAKIVEMVDAPGRPRLEIYNRLAGVDPRRPEELEEIQPLPLAVLLDLPLTLGRLRQVVFGDTLTSFTFADTVYTLFEFIDSIAWQLSFHGTPRECLIRS